MSFSSAAPHLDSSTGSIVKFKSPPHLSSKPFPQEEPHPHQTCFHPGVRNNSELLVPDLGADKLWRLTPGNREAGEEPWEVRASVDFPEGFGPYHLIVHDEIMYTVGEISTSIAVHRLPPLPASPIFLGTISTLEDPDKKSKDAKGGEILLVPKSSRSPALVYTARRDDPSPLGDPIIIFSLDGDGDSPGLKREGELHTGLKHVRGMAFSGGEENRYLIVGGLEGGGIKVFERLLGGVEFKEVAHLKEGGGGDESNCFLWL